MSANGNVRMQARAAHCITTQQSLRCDNMELSDDRNVAYVCSSSLFLKRRSICPEEMLVGGLSMAIVPPSL